MSLDFETFLDEQKKEKGFRCSLCRFFLSHADAATQIRAGVKKRGMYIAGGPGAPARHETKVTARSIVDFINAAYPEVKINRHNIYDHYRNKHEEEISGTSD